MGTEKDIIIASMKLLDEKNIVTVGIDGLGGAGKSTIADRVSDALTSNGVHVILLHIDDFITTRAVRYDPNYPQWQCYYELQWRYGYFREVIGRLLTNGDRVEVELYDKDNDSYIRRDFCTTKRTVILTEGIFLQRKELSGIFDLMAYVDVSQEERLRRVIGRDTYIGNEGEIIEKYENRYFPAERIYFSQYRPDLSADILIKQSLD